MALATTMTRRTSRPDPISNAYKVVLCVRAQGRIAADGKSVLRCCWRSRRIWACFGAFARVWRLYMACTREKEGWRRSSYVYLC